MKTVGIHNNSDTKIGAICGLLAGLWQFLMNYQFNIGLIIINISKIVEAGITAAVAGFMGILGKEIYKIGRNAWVAYFRARKAKRK